jgi:hypothetical protein
MTKYFWDGSNVFQAPDDYVPRAGTSEVTQPPATFLEPSWNGTAWVENADTATQQAGILEYQRCKKIDIDNACGDVFMEVLAVSGLSLNGMVFKSVAHLMKGMEAFDIKNDDDVVNNPTAKPRHPVSSHDDGNGNKKHDIIEAEAANRGITNLQMAELVEPNALGQISVFSVIETYRPVRADAIDAITVDPGNIGGDVYADYASAVAAVDAEMVTWQTEYETIKTALGI